MTAEDLRAKWDRETRELPKETRQKFLDLINEGKTIGEAREAAGIEELMVACAIIDQNIVSAKYLSHKDIGVKG